MSKKKKNLTVDALMQEIVMQGILADRGSSNNLTKKDDEALDYVQQIQENGKRHEQECYVRTMREMAALAHIVKGNQEELDEMQKVLKVLQNRSNEDDGYVHEIRKAQKKSFKKIDKQKKKLDKQQAEIKKCHKQLKEQAKTIRFLATYLGLGSMSDNLSKIQKTCIKEIDLQRANRWPSINERHSVIEGTCREVSKP